MGWIKHFAGNFGFPGEESIFSPTYHQNRNSWTLARDRRTLDHCSTHGSDRSKKISLHGEAEAENSPTGSSGSKEPPAIDRGVLTQVVDYLSHKADIICLAQAVILKSIPCRGASPIPGSVTKPLRADTDIAMLPHQGFKLTMVSLHRSPSSVKTEYHRILLLGVVICRQANEHIALLTMH